ncbi:MAG: hypothetical protein OEU36_25075, partial [Gammaproteobacteria bacterium]|nr:hypothetical protein [Gammaproteobacteria bacterium]
MKSVRYELTTGVDRELVSLRREIAKLKNQVRENERIWTGFRRIQVECVSAESLPNLITDLVGGGRREFPDVDCVSIAS